MQMPHAAALRTASTPAQTSQHSGDLSYGTDNEPLKHGGYRPDIDGLRAVAILAVLGFHAFPTLLTGGFVGVDVFFVISGYVIALSIFTDIDAGRFSLLAFYGRRIRRLFPALLLVLTSCFVAGWFMLYGTELLRLGKHIAAGAAFISNFTLWQESSYFDAPSSEKPLLHLWSLAVEEQFYLIWPAIFLLTRKLRGPVFLVTLAVALGSLILDLIWTSWGWVGAFYAPQARLWEPMIGVLLACAKHYEIPQALKPKGFAFDHLISAVTRVPDWPAKFANASSAAGAVLIVGSATLLSPANSYPGAWAIPPTIGTALLIGAGRRALLNDRLLSRPLPVFIGLISYPLYLWHWPFVAFYHVFATDPSVLTRLILFVCIPFCLAVVTYKTVELPVQRSRHRRTISIWLAALMVAMGVLGLETVQHKGFQSAEEGATDRARGWGQWAFIVNEECQARYGKQLSTVCISSSKTPTIVLLGDSHANQLYPGLAAVLPANEGVVSLGNAPALEGVAVNYEKMKNEAWLDSPQSFDRVMSVVENDKSIRTIVIGGNWEPMIHGKFATEFAQTLNGQVLLTPLAPVKSDDTPEAIFANAFTATIKRAVATGKHVVIAIDSPEQVVDAKGCLRQRRLAAFGLDRTCRFSTAEVLADQLAFRTLAEKVKEKYPQVKIFDPTPTLCPNGVCEILDPRPMYRDHNHLSEFSSDRLGPPLYQLIRSFDGNSRSGGDEQK
jgi:peptidoglycan/LPS O-acetylase OafA/YrhL